MGAPKDIAHSVALARPLALVADLADLASRQAWPIEHAAFVFNRVGGAFGFDRLRAAAAARPPADTYERQAVRRLIEDMLSEQVTLASAIMTFTGHPARDEPPEKAVSAVGAWSSAHAEPVRSTKRLVDEVEKAPGGWNFPKLTVANAALRELAGV